jgi:MFS family permease
MLIGPGMAALSGTMFAASFLGIAATGWIHDWRAAAILVGLTLAYAMASTTYHNAENTLAMSLAPAERRGEYLSMLSSVEGISQIAGPVVMSAVVLTFGEAGWLILGAAFAAAALLAIPVAATAQHRGRHRRNLHQHQHAGYGTWKSARRNPEPAPNLGQA